MRAPAPDQAEDDGEGGDHRRNQQDVDEGQHRAQPVNVGAKAALNIAELKLKKDPSSADMAMFQAITPNSFIKAGTPPAIMFFGTEDKLKVGADQYLSKAKPLGVRAELWTADGQAHGFFNKGPYAQLTTKKADEFLTSLGYLKGEPTVKVPEGAPALQQQE